MISAPVSVKTLESIIISHRVVDLLLETVFKIHNPLYEVNLRRIQNFQELQNQAQRDRDALLAPYHFVSQVMAGIPVGPHSLLETDIPQFVNTQPLVMEKALSALHETLQKLNCY